MRKTKPMPKSSDFSKIVAIGAKSKMGRKLASKRRLEGKKTKRLSISKVQKLLWAECKRIVRTREKDCFTCDAKNLQGSNAQTGHFIPSSTCGAFLRYDLRNLRLQCMRCNIHGGGQGAFFYRRLVDQDGKEYVDKLFRDKQKIINARDHYEALLEAYRLM
jgi:hypothetical protein